MGTILDETINGYERVVEGEESGRDYLIGVIDTYRITDDELIYLVYMAADIVMRRGSSDSNR